MLAVGRLYQDHEMVILSSCGVSPRYFQKVMFWFLLPIALFTAWVTLYVTPWSYEKERSLILEAQTSAPFAGLIAGKFNTLPGKKGVLYARKIESSGAMLDIWIEFNQNGNEQVLMAPLGRFEWIDERLALVLENGKSYQGLGTSQSDLTVQHFERFEGYLPELEASVNQKDKGIGTPTAVLFESQRIEDQVLLQWRLLIPVSVIAFGLLGLKLSKTQPRQGRFAKLFLGIVLFMIYSQLLVVVRKATLSGSIPIEVAFWPIPLMLIIYTLWQPRIKHSKSQPINMISKGST